MAYLAGERMTAGRTNRLQSKVYRAVASSALAGPQTNADVPGASITFTTETANATYKAVAVFDYRLTGAASTLGSGNIAVDGTVQSQFAVFRSAGATTGDGASVAQTYQGTLAAAGSHTIKLVASPVSNQQVNVYTSLLLTIQEVV